MKLSLLFIALAVATENNNESNEAIFEQNAYAPILVKIEDDEYTKVKKKGKSSNFIGVAYNKSQSVWQAQRWSKNEKNMLCNGTYKDEETAAHASDALARKLMANGEQIHRLNFLDYNTEERPRKTKTSKYIGVSYNKRKDNWQTYRRSKNEKRNFQNGSYKDEETAAHASDTLARKFMANGEQNHRLNFPDNNTEVHPKNIKETTSSKYFGVLYDGIKLKWHVSRWSKHEKKMIYSGAYQNEEIAGHASDALAMKLMANGEQNPRLNFPKNDTEDKKRKRPNAFDAHQNTLNFKK